MIVTDFLPPGKPPTASIAWYRHKAACKTFRFWVPISYPDLHRLKPELAQCFGSVFTSIHRQGLYQIEFDAITGKETNLRAYIAEPSRWGVLSENFSYFLLFRNDEDAVIARLLTQT